MAVKVLPKRLDANYWGLNPFAAKALHIKVHGKKSDIWLNPSLRGRARRKTIVHERIEAYLMSKKHEKYAEADHVARCFEKNVR